MPEEQCKESAAWESGDVISVHISKRKLSDKKEVICECCENMEAELNEVKSELSSLREIIRILQEEIHDIRLTTQPMENKGNGMFDAFSASERWTTLSSNRRRKLQYTRRNLRQPPLETSNQFATLTNLNGIEHSRCLTTVTQELSDCRKKRRSSFLSVRKTNNDKHKKTIIGDSHARDCAAELQKNLGKKFVVSGYVKPGAGMSAITHTVKKETEKLKSDYVVIVWGDQMT